MEQIETIASQVKADERLLLLFWALSEPMSVDQMAERGFLGQPGLQADSYERTFRRMREDLKDNGIYLQEVSTATGSAWRVDKEATYMQGNSDLTQPVMEISMLLEAYISSQQASSHPGAEAYLDRLRRAHDKLVLGSGKAHTLLGTKGDAQASGWENLLSAYAERKGVGFLYRDAQGQICERDVDIYGVFRHDEHTFFVAWDRTKNGMRVFRDDRIEVASVKPGKRTFEVPSDFSVEDYHGFAFEYGTQDFQMTLHAPDKPRAQALTRNHGTWVDDETWTIEGRDIDDAARWAAHALLRAGMQPCEPHELTDRVRDGLEKVVAQHG